MARVGVILSGCGVYDGGEIHESTLTLLSLAQRGARVVCAAPDMVQRRVVDHVTNQSVPGAPRNVLAEAARIARGDIVALSTLSADALDAVFVPGGLGAALNLSDYALSGADCEVIPELRSLLGAMFAARKPVGALCIAPPALARVLQERGVTGARLTIGNAEEHAANIEKMGQRHVMCAADACVVDEEHRIVTSPAYMLAGDIAELARGIDAAVAALLGMV